MVDIVADSAVAARTDPASVGNPAQEPARHDAMVLPERSLAAGRLDAPVDALMSAEALDAQVAALRRYDARMKGLARMAPTRLSGAATDKTRRASGLSDWHWYREMVLPTSMGKLPAPLFDDPAVRLVFAEPSLMMAGLVARALYARRAAVRRCIDRTLLAQLRVALGEGPIGRERLERLQRLTLADGDLPLPETLTPTHLAHDGLARLRRDHPTMVPVVVHFVLMQLDGTPMPLPDDSEKRIARPQSNAALARETAAFFASLPYLIPELS